MSLRPDTISAVLKFPDNRPDLMIAVYAPLLYGDHVQLADGEEFKVASTAGAIVTKLDTPGLMGPPEVPDAEFVQTSMIIRLVPVA